jgi:tRNA A37 threonylcarbamoyltransferase TsaD
VWWQAALGEYVRLGSTRDDSPGEAFDKAREAEHTHTHTHTHAALFLIHNDTATH